MDIDAEIADELMTSFDDHYDIIQASLNKLAHSKEDELVNNLFRSIHTVKGNAAIMQITPLVDFTHSIEDTISSIREGAFEPTFAICDVILTGIDRLRDLHKVYLFDKQCERIDEAGISSLFNHLSQSKTDADAQKHAEQLVNIFSPAVQQPQEKEQNNTPEAQVQEPVQIMSAEDISQHQNYLTLTQQQATDLTLFRTFAHQIDEHNDFWHGRSDKLFNIARCMCRIAGEGPDEVQLLAAIYMHDFGMTLLPNEILNKASKLNALEYKKLTQHAAWGYEILVRMHGWETAAKMVLQHHEKEDGSGYPNKIASEHICDGAQILSILDAFYAMTNLRADRSHRRSIMRAISEINACIGTQFSSHWVNIFNQSVRLIGPSQL